MNNLTSSKPFALAFAIGILLKFAIPAVAAEGEETADWKDGLITPVANPIYFEDPRITSEVRPIFIQHWLPSTFDFYGGSAPLDGDVRVYAVQLRYALTDKLALIATKDGFIEFKPEGALAANHGYGFADLAAGLKYAVIDDAENQLIVTPGFTFTIPTGDDEVLQGDGSGEWDLFVSAAKGFDDFHIMGNVGFRIPNNSNEQTAQVHYSLQLDYRVHQFFTPFAVVNGFTVLTEGDDQLLGAVPLNTEMYDLINFGSTEAAGRTMLTAGCGFRSKVTNSLSLGVAYEAGVISPKGIFDKRLTVDAIFRF